MVVNVTANIQIDHNFSYYLTSEHLSSRENRSYKE